MRVNPDQVLTYEELMAMPTPTSREIDQRWKKVQKMALQTTGTFPQLTTPRPKPKSGKKGK